MEENKGFRLSELAIIFVVVAVLALTLAPIFTRMHVMQANQCQVNLYRIGSAIRQYVNDWDGTYPTNRLNKPLNTFIGQQVNLSDPNLTGPDGKPIRFQYGVNWVEGLYSYIDRVIEGNSPSVWKCPAARNVQVGGIRAAVTYSLNSNLVECRDSTIKNAKITMMCREMDRLGIAILKPHAPTPTLGSAPVAPFLNSWEMAAPQPLKTRLHGEGSHILFADGHVKWFSLAYFPQVCTWSSTTNQWFNYTTNASDLESLRYSIAVTP